ERTPVEPYPAAADLPAGRADLPGVPPLPRGDARPRADHGPLLLRHAGRRLGRPTVHLGAAARAHHARAGCRGVPGHHTRGVLHAQGRAHGGVPAAPWPRLRRAVLLAAVAPSPPTAGPDRGPGRRVVGAPACPPVDVERKERMGILLRTFYRLPYPARCIAATVQGYRLRHRRYGPETEALVQEAH